MQRRKFLVGLGSLAAGASAAVGTGALSKTAMDRSLTGVISDDTNGAYVTIRDGTQNSAHLDTSGTEIAVRFDSTFTNGGDGLNRDSVNWFDNVMTVEIKDTDDGNSPDDYSLWFSINSNANNRGRIDFYNDQVTGRPTLVGSGNRQAFRSGFGSLQVGVKLNLLNLNLSDGDDLENDVFNLSSGEELFRVNVVKESQFGKY